VPRKIDSLAAVLTGALALSACGAIRGAPAPVIDSSQEKLDFSNYLSGDVLMKFYSPDSSQRGGMTPLAWRDAVIAARLEITDQNYQTFKNDLYAETSGINLGTDLLALGLTAAGTVAGKGVTQALSAASAGVLGASAAFNKDALYQKTLPALFAQMDADRTSVLVRIRSSELNDEAKYPLSAALTDITAYERAGTLETAIQALTTSATNQADANKQQLAQITGLTVLPADVAARKQGFSDYIQTLVKGNQKVTLDQIADQLKVPKDNNIITERQNILHAVDSKVNGSDAANAMTSLSNQLNAITHRSF
jgi:hypothetical protein